MTVTLTLGHTNLQWKTTISIIYNQGEFENSKAVKNYTGTVDTLKPQSAEEKHPSLYLNGRCGGPGGMAPGGIAPGGRTPGGMEDLEGDRSIPGGGGPFNIPAHKIQYK